MHPSTKAIVDLFTIDSEVSPARGSLQVKFYDFAEHLANVLPDNPEKTVALRKLLESRDCAMRFEPAN